MSSLKIYGDENINIAIIEGLKLRGIEAYSCKDFTNFGLSDDEQIAFAKSRNFVLLTHDTDFLRAVHEKKLGHEGILFAPQTKDIGKIIRKIEYIISILTAEDMKNHVEFL